MKIYTVTIQASINVEAESESAAIDQACLDATFGTDLCDISLVDVQTDNNTQEVSNHK